ncbi:hypothetical protein L596_004900 [Steinernema carpocapsae]|uniref:Uncharacterized protein n=1 Tax=Steinernema carpocapsae TaxID=34508 RepID=A0A4U8UX71_STECR|nr:hypothetical protein L596_004900 [Steinernema carpocapsae]
MFGVDGLSHQPYTVQQIRRKFRSTKYFLLVLDSVIGISLAYFLWISPVHIWTWDGLKSGIQGLERTIDWLTYPAGLKLNHRVNKTLSQFFLYHIFLWETFVSVIWSKYGAALFLFSGAFGISSFVAATIDVLNILTIHILCFHIYASSSKSPLRIPGLFRSGDGRTEAQTQRTLVDNEVTTRLTPPLCGHLISSELTTGIQNERRRERTASGGGHGVQLRWNRMHRLSVHQQHPGSESGVAVVAQHWRNDQERSPAHFERRQRTMRRRAAYGSNGRQRSRKNNFAQHSPCS